METVRFNNEEDAQGFAEKLSNSDVYEGDACARYDYGGEYVVEIDTEKEIDADAVGTFASNRNGSFDND